MTDNTVQRLLADAESDPDRVSSSDVRTLVGALSTADTDTARRIAEVVATAAEERPATVAGQTRALIDGIVPSDTYASSFDSTSQSQIESVLDTLQALADHDPQTVRGDLRYLLESMLDGGYELDFETPHYSVSSGVQRLAEQTSTLRTECIETLRRAIETGTETRKLTALSLLIDVCDSSDDPAFRAECAAVLADTLISSAPPPTPVDDSGRNSRRVAAAGLASLADFGGEVGPITDQLSIALEDDDPVVRSEAARALGGIAVRDPDVVVDLLGQLIDQLDDETVEETAELNPWKNSVMGTVEYIPASAAASAIGSLWTTPYDQSAGASKSPSRGTARTAVAALTDVLDGSLPAVEAASAEAIGRIGEYRPGVAADATAELVTLARSHAGENTAPDETGNNAPDVRNSIAYGPHTTPEEAAANASDALATIASGEPERIAQELAPVIDDLDATAASRRKRAAAVLGIVGRSTPTAVADALDPLRERLDDDAESVRWEVANAFRSVAADTDTEIEQTVRTGLDDALSALCTQLGEETECRATFVAAIGTLGQCGEWEARRATTELISVVDGESAVSRNALSGLSDIRERFPDAVAKRMVVSALTPVEETARPPEAIGLLGDIGSTQPSLLDDALLDIRDSLRRGSTGDTEEIEDWREREAAATALRRIAEADPERLEPVVPALSDALTDPAENVRIDAADALKEIGTANPEAVSGAIDALEALRDGAVPDTDTPPQARVILEDDPTPAEAAAEALTAIGSAGDTTEIYRGESGSSTKTVCPQCSREASGTADYCKDCGTELQERCSQCDTAVETDDSYCSGCGERLDHAWG